MDLRRGFYERLFNFCETRYRDIEGKPTGLKSRTLTHLALWPDPHTDQRKLRRQEPD